MNLIGHEQSSRYAKHISDKSGVSVLFAKPKIIGQPTRVRLLAGRSTPLQADLPLGPFDAAGSVK